MNDKTVLLVEDNQDDVDLTLHCFKSNQMTNNIVVKRDGAQALDFLFSPDVELPNLVLLDLKMPKIGGLEVLRRIRANPKTKRLPVVVLTSSKQELDRARVYDEGANSYICKPVDLDQFTQAVKQLGVYWLLLNEPPPEAFQLV